MKARSKSPASAGGRSSPARSPPTRWRSSRCIGRPDWLFDPAGGWSARPFAPAHPPAFDLDLRLSAARLDVYGRTLSNAAASVIVKDGRLSASLIEAAAYDGRLDGEASVEWVGQDLNIRARAELADADLGAALADFGQPVATGRGEARLAVEASGSSPAAAVADLSGSASLEAADGGIVGVNLEEALRRSQRRPIDVAPRHAARRDGVRQARRFFRARQRPGADRARRYDEPRHGRRLGRPRRSRRRKMETCASMRFRRTQPARNCRTPRT